MRLDPLLTIPLLLTACSGSFQAPVGSTVTVPGDFTVGWSTSYNDIGDGEGAVIWADIGVADDQGLPLERIEVEVNSNFGGVYFIPEEAILTVDQPTGGDVVWDTESESYYQFSAEVTDSGYYPTYFVGETDARGTLRLYGYVDAFPGDDTTGSYSSVQLVVSIGVDSGSFTINPSLL